MKGYFFNFIGNPNKTFDQLLKDPKRIWKSMGVMMIMATLYGVAAYLISLNNMTSDLEPCLNIPNEHYYYFEAFIMIPVFFVGWLIISGLLFILSKAMHGDGLYEDILACVGYSIALPTYVTLIADAATSLLGYYHVMSAKWWSEQIATFGTAPFFFLWTIMLAEVIWIIFLISLSIYKIEHFSKFNSVLLAILCFTVYQGFLLIFIR